MKANLGDKLTTKNYTDACVPVLHIAQMAQLIKG